MEPTQIERIYITWHYTTHGIAYLKHVLSAFYRGAVTLDGNHLNGADGLDQLEMNRVFDPPEEGGFVFERVYYLTAPQAAFDRLSSRRFNYRRNMLSDEEIIRSDMQAIWKDVIELEPQRQGNRLEQELAYVKQAYPDRYETFLKQIWRDMQHYSIEEQIQWFTQRSNAAALYARRLHEVKLDIDNLRDEQAISKCLLDWIRCISDTHPDAQLVINVSLGSNETQVAWFILGDANCLPNNTVFIKTLDDKLSEPKNRFQEFSIKPAPVKTISNIIQKTIKIYEKTSSEKRRLAALKWDAYIKQGFSILLLGERGTGKSRIVEEKTNGNLLAVDCAAFEDDAKAEAELFGYEKGAFTGADKNKAGLFHEAKNKILFLDEVHNLSKRVQAKLMKVLQTDENNQFSIRKLGANKVEKIQCTVVFASNKCIRELKQYLLPDFFDRIAQLVIVFPPLREARDERRQDWEEVWKQLKFDEPVPKDEAFLSWLEQQPLYGNFRDLQKIAIYYKSFMDFDDELKNLIDIRSASEYAKKEFGKYHADIKGADNTPFFTEEKTAKEMEAHFHKELILWAENRYSESQKQVAEKLGITVKTLANWKKIH